MDGSMMDMCAMEKIQVKSLFILNNTFEFLTFKKYPNFFLKQRFFNLYQQHTESTVNGDLGMYGVLAQKHAEMDCTFGHGKQKYRHPMEDKLVMILKQRKQLDVTQDGVQLTVHGELGLNGLLAQKHAERESDLAQGKQKYLHKMGDRLVLMEKQRKPLSVTRAGAQSIVNGELGLNGLLAQKHAEEERNRAQDKQKYSNHTGENLVKEKEWKQLDVTRICAQSTVNGDLMVNGRLAHRHVEEE